MGKTLRFVVVGLALGAVAGAIAGLIYHRTSGASDDASGATQEPLADMQVTDIARLGLLVLGTVRQILALTE